MFPDLWPDPVLYSLKHWLPFTLPALVTLFPAAARLLLWSAANFRKVAMKKTNSVCDILATLPQRRLGIHDLREIGFPCVRLTTSGVPGEGGRTFAAEDRPDLQEKRLEMPGNKPHINREPFPKIHPSDEELRTYFAYDEYLVILHRRERGSGYPWTLAGSARTESCPGGQRKVKD